MGNEIDLLKNYPRSKRDTSYRANNKSENDRLIARKFGEEFFDGNRKHGYGGFSYSPKFWQPVIPTFIDYYSIKNGMKILDVGCAKGFMIYDFKQIMPGVILEGIDISKYAIENSVSEIKENLKVGNAKNLPYKDNTFDLVISINTIHNLNKNDCAIALNEISRVSKKYSFITVDAYRNDDEKKKMFDWNLTAKTIMSVNEWKIFFENNHYYGDYYWFMP